MIVRWQAPGRVNLIGEHTDYNAGWVLPCAIEQACTATLETRSDGLVEVRSAQRTDVVRLPIGDLRPGIGEWAGYALGAVWVARARGVTVPGLTISLDSDVPYGAGLSSSAALVCSVVTALDDLLGLRLGPAELLAMSRSVENDFVGAPTGGMDQLAALRCTAGHALLCDMRTLATEPVPLALADVDLLVLDTRAPHRHADGEYRRRRAGCERAAAALGVPALRDITMAGLDDALDRLSAAGDDELRRYTRHVVTENERVLRAVDALRAGDPAELAELGRLFTASHASMRDDFRITAPEVDLAADTLATAGALGARMTGGGFGGCVIALMPRHRLRSAVEAVQARFAAQGFGAPAWFVARPSAGAHRLVPG